MKCNFRIITSGGRVKYAGDSTGSWFTLDAARKLVDYRMREMIYEYDDDGNRLWEVF